MKVNTRTKILFRKYTGRINMLLCLGFLVTFVWLYADYIQKEVKQGPLPLYMMFFKAPTPPSWRNATPFEK
jgi:uncharacterized membrane protein